MSPNGLAKKRSDAFVVIVAAAAATGTANAVPTPTIEVVKQFAIATADTVMCMQIGKVYFQDVLTDWNLGKTLRALGGVGAGALLTYGGVKLADGLAAEVLNWAPPVGWIASACTAALSTCAVGLIFWLASDRATRHHRDVGDELADIRREFDSWRSGGEAPEGLGALTRDAQADSPTRGRLGEAERLQDLRVRPEPVGRLAVKTGR